MSCHCLLCIFPASLFVHPFSFDRIAKRLPANAKSTIAWKSTKLFVGFFKWNHFDTFQVNSNRFHQSLAWSTWQWNCDEHTFHRIDRVSVNFWKFFENKLIFDYFQNGLDVFFKANKKTEKQTWSSSFVFDVELHTPRTKRQCTTELFVLKKIESSSRFDESWEWKDDIRMIDISSSSPSSSSSFAGNGQSKVLIKAVHRLNRDEWMTRRRWR